MTPFILYQLKVAIGVMFFTGLYYILFRKETFYRTNRIYLVSSLILSTVLPLIRIPEFNPPQAQAVTEIISSVTVIPGESEASITVERTPVLVVIYRTMLVLFSLHFAYLVVKLLLSVFRFGSVRLGRYRIISLSRKSHSFSFFNLIFVASAINNEGEQNQVLQHEMAHARQWHSIDIVIIQIFKIFQWFNPFIYLAEKALQETHEYLADEAVLEQDGDSSGYRLLLLNRVFGVQPGIVSLFNYSLIKNRMIMMTKQKSPLRNRLKYLSVLPVIMLIVFGLSCTNKEDVIPSTISEIAEEANKGIDETKITDNDSVYIVVDEMASFQGGNLESFREWVQKNLKYPEEAVKNGISGRVTVQFSINSQGILDNVKILRGVDPLLDYETVRVIESSPDWEPAKYKGRVVKQQFVIPVIFALSDSKIQNKELAPPPPPKPSTEESRAAAKEGKVIFADISAKFQGGSLETFREWVQKNIKYPEEALKKGILGRVTVQFTVTTAGKVEDIKILRGVDPMLDKETYRVLNSSPAWEPGENEGVPINQQFVMPVVFSLESK